MSCVVDRKNMRTMSKALRTNIVQACLEMNRAGLNQGSSGNVSHLSLIHI